MSEPRVIKKYPNRRLYDTVESRYITLSDIRRLVLDKTEFVVVDKKTQENITRSILLQVIAEQEHQGEPLMSQDFLAQIIRSYGSSPPGLVGSYLEQSLKLYAAQPVAARERNANFADSGNGLAQHNYARWKSVQEEIFKTLMNASTKARETEDGEHKSSPPV